jgi:hypothetical protein
MAHSRRWTWILHHFFTSFTLVLPADNFVSPVLDRLTAGLLGRQTLGGLCLLCPRVAFGDLSLTSTAPTFGAADLTASVVRGCAWLLFSNLDAFGSGSLFPALWLVDRGLVAADGRSLRGDCSRATCGACIEAMSPILTSGRLRIAMGLIGD